MRGGDGPAMSVKTRKLEFPCPVCGSGEVFYTCTPNCCYNHVCGACGATFEPETKRKGGMMAGITPPDPLPDATDPTTECAACGSTAVYMTEDGAVVCGQCGAALELEISEVNPA
jgi:transcription elongation factor Elf1